MRNRIFFPKEVTIKTNFTASIDYSYLIPLNDFRVWIYFSDGHWIYHDCLENKTISKGELNFGATQLTEYIKAPKALDNVHIVYANSATFKLERLNLETGQIDQTWSCDAPCTEALQEVERSNASRIATDALNELKIEILRKSKHVAVLDSKEIDYRNTTFYLTVYGPDQSRIQFTQTLRQKVMNLSKVNEDNLLVLWHPHHEGLKFEFHLADIYKKDEGFQSIKFQETYRTLLLDCFPWEKNTIVFFGNADGCGVPDQYVCDFVNKTSERRSLPYSPEGSQVILAEVLPVDTERKYVLAIEGSEPQNVVLLDGNTGKASFMKRQGENSMYAVSLDGKYFVEYESSMSCEADPNCPNETKLKICRYFGKKIYILHLLNEAKTKTTKESFFSYYKSPYVAKHIVEMICGEKLGHN